MGEPERLNGLLRENVVPVIGLRSPDMLQRTPRGMGVGGNHRGSLLVFASRFIRAHHQVLMPECPSLAAPQWHRPSAPDAKLSFLSSPAGLFALITKFSCLNAYCSQHCQPHLSVQLGPRRWYESAWCLLGFAGGNGFNQADRAGFRHVFSDPRRLFSRYPRLLGSLFPRDAQFVLQLIHLLGNVLLILQVSEVSET